MAPSPNCFSIWATVIFKAGWEANIASQSGLPLTFSTGLPALAGKPFFAMRTLCLGLKGGDHEIDLLL